jgi:hypothetical protein
MVRKLDHFAFGLGGGAFRPAFMVLASDFCFDFIVLLKLGTLSLAFYLLCLSSRERPLLTLPANSSRSSLILMCS